LKIFSVLPSSDVSEQVEIREKLIEEIEADLIGPRVGETKEKRAYEILSRNKSPEHEYFAGVLYPGNWEVESEEMIHELKDDDNENSSSNVANDKLFKPSSFGLTCRLTPQTKEIKIIVTYGEYESLKNKKQVIRHHRTPRIEHFDIPIESITDKEKCFTNNPNFCVNYSIIRDENSIILDFYVINKTERDFKIRQVPLTDFIFQPKIILESVNGESSFIDINDGFLRNHNPPSDKHLDILFRNKVSFGKGHLCAVVWDEKNIKKRSINKINTSFIPQQRIDIIQPTECEKFESSLVMNKIGSCNDIHELRELINPIINDYTDWIQKTENFIQHSQEFNEKENQILKKQLDEAKIVVQRMTDGLNLLESNQNAFDSFMFANKAIAWQQVHGKWVALNTEKDEVTGKTPIDNPEPILPNGKKPTWRLFQIAFILMNLESIANPKSKNREVVDLLWFPTGGGKTEAYLGLVAFVIAFRRLRGMDDDGEHGYESYGTAVLMRYTLRLLTIQQFQRAATLMCACEELRLKNKSKWGNMPFQVGLWVGTNVTPNKRKDADDVRRDMSNSRDHDLGQIKSNNPYILINCPWCGKKLRYTDGKILGEPTQWRLYCPRNACTFSNHVDTFPDVSIPVVLVDEDIYSRCPSLIISTVDKFAQIALKPEVRAIFGKSNTWCDVCGFYDSTVTNHPASHKGMMGKKPEDYIDKNLTLHPPELIIQDELHLISGPLGTLSGLFETAIEYLCTHNDVKPKIISSTATTRDADNQIRKLFDRKITKIFPTQILNFGDTFFSEINSDESGKKYLGVLATGKSGLTVLAKVSATILRRIRQFEEDKKYSKEDLDPYFTLVSYFNSVRELSGASMSYKDSVPDFMKQIYNNNDYSPPKILDDDVLVKPPEDLTPLEKNPIPAWKQLRGYSFKELFTEELTSRRNSGEIPAILRKLSDGIQNTPLPVNCSKDDLQPIDLLLATNMLSVGVDVGRLGTMIVNGQPKLNSEYIQATGRIGRQNPGLIVTLYSYTKPRDLSYFENFKSFHSTYYKDVETVSLTPFTIRARQNGLFGVIVGMCRMLINSLSQQKNARDFDQTNTDQLKELEKIILHIEKRVASVDYEELTDTKDNIKMLFAEWKSHVEYYQTNLQYKEPWSLKISTNLLEKYIYLLKTDNESTKQLIPVPISLRNTEQEHNLRYMNLQEDEKENE
jgi:hypothetical protein